MSVVDVKALEELAGPVVDGLGYELVTLEWKHELGRWVLRVFIDRPDGRLAEIEGISLEDCTRVSHALSAELDVADLIHVPYSLEVSSPGLERPLVREADFRRFAGKRAKIRTRHPVGPVPAPSGTGGRRNFTGALLGVEEGRVRIDVDGQVFEIPVEEVEKAHLQYDG
ncbi:MAG TPA: ribosome maturation factor RimP [Polyangia bacterium]|jgi:ribosome maturation factor RimP|nr:ribosome maturation factor RimP [Polyangia bacterium]